MSISKLIKTLFFCAFIFLLAACGRNSADPANAPASANAAVASASAIASVNAVEPAGSSLQPAPGVVGGGNMAPAQDPLASKKSTKVPSWQPVNYAACGLQFRGTVYLLDEASGSYEYRSSPFHTGGECEDRTIFQATPVLFDQMAKEFPIVDQAYNEEHDAAAAFVSKSSNLSIVNPVSGTEMIVALNPDRFWSHCYPEPNARVMVVGELGGKQMYMYLIDTPPAKSFNCKDHTIFRQGDELLRLPILN